MSRGSWYFFHEHKDRLNVQVTLISFASCNILHLAHLKKKKKGRQNQVRDCLHKHSHKHAWELAQCENNLVLFATA